MVQKFLENPESAYDLTINDINKYFKKMIEGVIIKNLKKFLMIGEKFFI